MPAMRQQSVSEEVYPVITTLRDISEPHYSRRFPSKQQAIAYIVLLIITNVISSGIAGLGVADTLKATKSINGCAFGYELVHVSEVLQNNCYNSSSGLDSLRGCTEIVCLNGTQ